MAAGLKVYVFRLLRPAPNNLRHKVFSWSFLFTFITTAQIAQIAIAALISPLTAWDAWVNWASKAKLDLH